MNTIFSLHEKRNKKQFFPKLNFIEQFVWQRCRGDTKLRQTRKIDIYFCWRCDEFVLLNYWEKIHCEGLFIFNSIFDNFDWNWFICIEFVETFLSTFYRVAQPAIWVPAPRPPAKHNTHFTAETQLCQRIWVGELTSSGYSKLGTT